MTSQIKGFVTLAAKNSGKARQTYFNKIRAYFIAQGLPAEQAKHQTRNVINERQAAL